MGLDELTPIQARFVQEYLKDLNGSQACLRAGYKTQSPSVRASQLLALDKVKAAVQKGMEARTKRNLVDQDWVIKRLLQIAGTDMTELASWNESGVRFKDSGELSDAARASVQQIEQVMNEHGGGLKIKQYDRMAALKLLGQHLGMFKEQLEVNATVTARPAEAIDDDELEQALTE